MHMYVDMGLWFDEDDDDIWEHIMEETERRQQQINDEFEQWLANRHRKPLSTQFITDGEWRSYPDEVPDAYHRHCLVKFPDGQERELWYDEVYGWCCNFDDMDYPHFIYDFDCEWTVILSDTEDDDDDY